MHKFLGRLATHLGYSFNYRLSYKYYSKLFCSAFERVKNCLTMKEYDQIMPLCDEELANESSTKVPEALLLRGTMKLLQGMGDSALEDFTKITSMIGLDKTVTE